MGYSIKSWVHTKLTGCILSIYGVNYRASLFPATSWHQVVHLTAKNKYQLRLYILSVSSKAANTTDVSARTLLN